MNLYEQNELVLNDLYNFGLETQEDDLLEAFSIKITFFCVTTVFCGGVEL